MRSPEGIMTSDGSLIFDGTMRRPPTTHWLRPGMFSPYQSIRHSLAVGPASGAPPFNQSSSRTNSFALSPFWIESHEAPELLHRQPGIERPEQGLQDVDRQFAPRDPPPPRAGARSRAGRPVRCDRRGNPRGPPSAPAPRPDAAGAPPGATASVPPMQ
jgi:hypothetical protein